MEANDRAGTESSTTSSVETSTSTTTVARTTSSTTTTTTAASSDLTLPEDTPSGVHIEPPPDFPALVDLARSSSASNDPPHPRARIWSGVAVSEHFGGQVDPTFLANPGVTITYYDGFTIWDFGEGLREARVPDGRYFTMTADGTWEESDQFEWPAGAMVFEWSEIQLTDEGSLEEAFDVVGYETLAGTTTIHLRLIEASPDVWADIWLDATGATIRAVVDQGLGDRTSENKMWLVWDVETLAPENIGPLPESP